MDLLNKEGNALKCELLEKRFSRMNAMQQEAVFQTNGPLLILAGAGSGKTTVLVNRIAYIINFGNAYHEEIKFDGEKLGGLKRLSEAESFKDYELKSVLGIQTVKPWNILAITFTNKAAGELKDRLSLMLGEDGDRVSAGTFHSICLRILRSEIERIGYNSKFTVYDSDDSQRLVKDCIKELVLDDKMFPPKSVLAQISRAKDSLITPAQYTAENSSDFKKSVIAKIYTAYQSRLKENNALDFDDIICHTVKIFKENPDVLEKYREKYRYVLVDEYQDTNHVQYELVRLISGKYENLCVVGDDDQSIYKFRGATIENILNFEKDFKDARVIRLEQNYRSTQNILSAANEIIKNNLERKGKNLWTDKGDGAKVVVYRSHDENGEAQFVANKIIENVQAGGKFSDNAVLYRMNAQSAGIERRLVQMAVPYRIVGGTKFYDRKEIKDVLAYLHIIDNPNDDVRLKRIVNEPKRGIGDATVGAVEQIAHGLGISMFEVMKNAEEYPEISKRAGALKVFTDLIDSLSEINFSFSMSDLIEDLIEKTDYTAYLKAQGFEGEGRLENIAELKSNILKYEEANEDGDLSGFLEEIALYTDLDNMNDSDDKVTLMTMHSAKGLEFDNVYIVGMEENLFPSYLSLNSEAELEEERRLAYVAVTRAKANLYISNVEERMIFGKTNRNRQSRFLSEIPEEYIEFIDDAEKRRNLLAAAQQAAQKPKTAVRREMPNVGRAIEAVAVDYTVGDAVRHKVFGDGVIKSMESMSNDILVEIEFKSGVTKRIMANYAKLVKI